MTGAKYQFYATQDDKVPLFCCVEPKFWRNFCRAIDRPDLEAQGAASDGNTAVDWGGPELRRELTSVIRTRTLSEWVAMAAEYDIAMGSANQGVEEMAADPGFRVREVVLEDKHPVAGTYVVVGTPTLVAGQPYTVRHHAPAAGEQSRDILEECGFTESEIDTLVDAGTVLQQDRDRRRQPSGRPFEPPRPGANVQDSRGSGSDEG